MIISPWKIAFGFWSLSFFLPAVAENWQASFLWIVNQETFPGYLAFLLALASFEWFRSSSALTNVLFVLLLFPRVHSFRQSWLLGLLFALAFLLNAFWLVIFKGSGFLAFGYHVWLLSFLLAALSVLRTD